MSQENVERVRRVYDALNRADLDAVMEEAADDFVLDFSNSIGPVKGTYRGKRQAREFWAALHEDFDELRWDPEEIIEADESTVVVVSRIRGRGRRSGVTVDALAASVSTVSDGQWRSVKLYQSKADALEAAGLRE